MLKQVAPEWYDVLLGAAMGFYRSTPVIPFFQIFHGGDEPKSWLSADEHPRDKWRDQRRMMPLHSLNPGYSGR